MIDFGKLARNKHAMTRERQAIYDMVNSEGWKITFEMLTREMKDMLNASNIKDEVELKAVQKATQILTGIFEEIYSILVDVKELSPDLDENDLYQVLNNESGNPEEQF